MGVASGDAFDPIFIRLPGGRAELTYTEGFYPAMGARRTGQRESASIPGSWLPVFAIAHARRDNAP